jgi:dolichol-phosphate mannosyltransferase
LNETTPLELALIIPTFNEARNIETLLGKIEAALQGIRWEVIFVDDDSSDGTAERIRSIARHAPHIRVLQRLGRRGLSSACIEGFLATAAPFIAVMDADLQHDETRLKTMLTLLQQQDGDLIIGSRFIDGGSARDGLNSPTRHLASHLATRCAHLLLKTSISDPMSGFFMFRTATIAPLFPALSGQGFKILLDIIATAPTPLRILEIPYHMRARQAGESKLDANVIREYLLLLLDKTVGRHLPLRFLLFVMVGFSGVGVHLAALYTLNQVLLVGFFTAQIISTLIAMTNNFLLNNWFTYRDQRLHGQQLIRGYISFCLACSLGAVINVQIAELMHENHAPWWLAGTGGAIIGAVWNYSMTAFFTWRKR